MRIDDENTFGIFNKAVNREPKIVVEFVYNDRNLAITSHEAPRYLQARLLEGLLVGVSGVSQSVFPLDGRSEIGGITITALDREDRPIWAYEHDRRSWWTSGYQLRANVPTRLRAWCELGPYAGDITEAIFSANDILCVYILSSGVIRVYRVNDDASDDYPALVVPREEPSLIELEWDGAGNYTISVDGLSATGNYDQASPSATLSIGGDYRHQNSGVVWGAKIWEEGMPSRHFPLVDGHDEPRCVISGETLTKTRLANPYEGYWRQDIRPSVANLLSSYIAAEPSETLHEREVRVSVGFTDDFNDYVRVNTSYIATADDKDGKHVFRCQDVTKSLRTTIFEKKLFRLAADIDDGTASPQPDISLHAEPEDVRCPHTAGFAESPNETVGYIKVEDTGEIIKYTGITASPPALTGITRGVFGTSPVATSGDYGGSADNFPELTEYIYLEMPAPQIAYAVITGEILGTGDPADTLPDHWHMGVPTDRVATSEWEGIGADLYDSATAGLILSFSGVDKTDGKKFVENEIHRLIGTYAPVRADGRLGLARINNAISDAAYLMTASWQQIASHSALRNKPKDVINNYRIDYGWNGEKFLNRFVFNDADSQSANGVSKQKVLKFKGLQPSRHSVQLIAQLINNLQDRYRNPPQELDISLLPEFNTLEANDMIRVALYQLQDVSRAGFLLRAFEVQQVTNDYVRGDVRLRLFASTGEPGAPMYTPQVVLDDAFYTSRGTDIASITPSVVDGSGNITADFTLTGDPDMNAAGAIYYYDGDLTLPSGRTLTIIDNVQLRVRGTFTRNGDIDGVGNGKAGAVDNRVIGQGYSNTTEPFGIVGTPGFVGNTHSSDAAGIGSGNEYSLQGVLTEGQHSAFPSINPRPGATDVSGIPSDLRGTSGGTGAHTVSSRWGAGREHRGAGGAGGASGAGLCIIARGLAGTTGNIDLSGADGQTGAAYNSMQLPSGIPGELQSQGVSSGDGFDYYAGTGAGGGPGCLLVLIDGDAGLPDLGSIFIARTGRTIPVGYIGERYEGEITTRLRWPIGRMPYSEFTGDFCGLNIGYADGIPQYVIDNVDLSPACRRVMWIPEDV